MTHHQSATSFIHSFIYLMLICSHSLTPAQETTFASVFFFFSCISDDWKHFGIITLQTQITALWCTIALESSLRAKQSVIWHETNGSLHRRVRPRTDRPQRERVKSGSRVYLAHAHARSNKIPFSNEQGPLEEEEESPISFKNKTNKLHKLQQEEKS